MIDFFFFFRNCSIFESPPCEVLIPITTARVYCILIGGESDNRYRTDRCGRGWEWQ